MGVVSLHHNPAINDCRIIELESLYVLTLQQWYEWLLLEYRDCLWGLVGFYNYQELIFILSSLSMRCYILEYYLPGIIYL